MEIEKLIKHMREEAQDYRSGRTLGRAFADAEDVLDEAATALEQLQAENEKLKAQVPRWIPVEERLPEEKQRVIVRCERVGTSVGWILWGNWMADIGPDAGKVTHWMPLPAPPDRRPPEGEEDINV